MSPKAEVRRHRLSIPEADEVINEWFEAQVNISASIRHVLREYIERYGIDDPTCRPVEKAPRRGRPPSGAMSRDDEDREDRDYETNEANDDEAVVAQAKSDPASEPDLEPHGPIDLADFEPEPEVESPPLMAGRMAAAGKAGQTDDEVEQEMAKVFSRSAKKEQPKVASPKPPSEGGQFDMGDIFGAMR